MKKYMEIGIPVLLLILIFIIGGFNGIISNTFDGCLKDEPSCMGPGAVKFLDLRINTGFISSLVFSIVVVLIGFILNLVIMKIKKEQILFRTQLYIFLWTLLVIILTITLFRIEFSKHILY